MGLGWGWGPLLYLQPYTSLKISQEPLVHRAGRWWQCVVQSPLSTVEGGDQ